MSVYKEKSEKLRRLRLIYKNLYNTDCVLCADIKKEIYNLDSELKKIEKSVGVTYRPIGNYNRQVKEGENLTLWQKIISIV